MFLLHDVEGYRHDEIAVIARMLGGEFKIAAS